MRRIVAACEIDRFVERQTSRACRLARWRRTVLRTRPERRRANMRNKRICIGMGDEVESGQRTVNAGKGFRIDFHSVSAGARKIRSLIRDGFSRRESVPFR